MATIHEMLRRAQSIDLQAIGVGVIVDTKDELIEAIRKFKNDPRTHNPKMTDENADYWKKKNYTIERITIKTEELETI